MADHNDPNAVNSIFSDIDVSAADLYDIFGFPSDDRGGNEKVLIALTFAAVPQTGVFDTDMLYRILIAPDRRLVRSGSNDTSLAGLLAYLEGVKEKYLKILKPAEVRVSVDNSNRASLRFIGFPGGSFSASIAASQSVTLSSPGGHQINAFIGGRDDAFFNDLPGFFRPINYDPQLPQWGHGMKKELPAGPLTWNGNRFRKDQNGNFRFVYSGEDARAGQNCNAIILELPLSFLTATADEHRVVNTWGESWVLKAAHKVESIPDDPLWIEHPHVLLDALTLDDELKKYKLVDTDGQAFADAPLSEREDNRQLGANNFWLAPHFIKRLGHLGWGFGPSIIALGLASAFDHDNSPVSVHRTYSSVLEAFPRVSKILFQELNMPDNSWNRKGLEIPLRRAVDIFIPNVNSIDMDTTGTWPFGRRLED